MALAAPTPDCTEEFPFTRSARRQHLEHLSHLRWSSLGIVMFVGFVSFVDPVAGVGDAPRVSVPAPSRMPTTGVARPLKRTPE